MTRTIPDLFQHIRADLIFHERQPGEAGLDPVQWQMPDPVYRRLQRAARRQGTDVNTLIRDLVCAALTERAEAIRRLNAGETPDHAAPPHHHDLT